METAALCRRGAVAVEIGTGRQLHSLLAASQDVLHMTLVCGHGRRASCRCTGPTIICLDEFAVMLRSKPDRGPPICPDECFYGVSGCMALVTCSLLEVGNGLSHISRHRCCWTAINTPLAQRNMKEQCSIFPVTSGLLRNCLQGVCEQVLQLFESTRGKS